jgi:hypothetical protein
MGGKRFRRDRGESLEEGIVRRGGREYLREACSGFERSARAAKKGWRVPVIDGAATGKRRRQICDSQLPEPRRAQRFKVAGEQRWAALLHIVLADKRNALFVLSGDR